MRKKIRLPLRCQYVHFMVELYQRLGDVLDRRGLFMTKFGQRLMDIPDFLTPDCREWDCPEDPYKEQR